MEPLQFVAWVIVHIAVPIFAPIALLPLLGIGVTFRKSAHGIVRNAVKNGQLLWVAISMSAGCCYELAGYLEHAVPPGRNMAWTCWGFCVFIIAISAVLVMVGAIDALEDEGNISDERPSRIMLISMVLTAATAVVFSVVHFLISY